MRGRKNEEALAESVLEAETLAQEVYASLVHAAAVLSNEVHRLLKQHGLSESTYNTLRILRAHGTAGCRAAAITNNLLVPVPDVTRLVDRLIAMGLATRERASDDARAVTVKITPKGRTLLRKVDAPLADLNEQQMAALPVNRLASLRDMLASLADREPE